MWKTRSVLFTIQNSCFLIVISSLEFMCAQSYRYVKKRRGRKKKKTNWNTNLMFSDCPLEFTCAQSYRNVKGRKITVYTSASVLYFSSPLHCLLITRIFHPDCFLQLALECSTLLANALIICLLFVGYWWLTSCREDCKTSNQFCVHRKNNFSFHFDFCAWCNIHIGSWKSS